MKKFLLEGCRWDGESFKCNWEKDSEGEIIYFQDKLYKARKQKINCFFCYKINKVEDGKADLFKKQLKNNSGLINDEDRRKIIANGIEKFLSENKNYDTVISSKSSSNLSNEMGQELKKKLQATYLLDSLVKNDYREIIIDFQKYLKTAKTDEDIKKRTYDLNKDFNHATKEGEFKIKKVHNFRRHLFSNFIKAKDSKISDDIKGKSILLIDDIYTSGSTMIEMIRVISMYEPKEITFMSLLY